MWLNLCLSLVFLHVISTNLAQHDIKNGIDANKDPEAIFAGVIKNISRVNNVLQELISNYEHLQKIYKSQENLESASSDGEIDEVFKSRNKKVRSETEVTTTKPADNYFPATQMIWSKEENTDGNSGNDNSESNDTDKEEKYVAKTENRPDVKPVVEEKIKNNENDESVASGVQDKSELNNPEKHQKPDQSEVKHRETPVILNQEFVKPKQAEIIFVDTQNTNANKEQNTRDKAPDSSQDIAHPKTRYSRVSHSHQETKNKKFGKYKSKDLPRTDDLMENEESKNLQKVSRNNTKNITLQKVEKANRKVEKKLHSESFSPKYIWDEIISNKPIQLEAHSEMIFQKVRKDNSGSRSKKGLKMRSTISETGPVNATNKNKTENIKTDLPKNSTTEILEADVSFGKDEFEANVLREAYGDACLKLVVRKCYVAVKRAGKAICERFKCKGTYKEKFDSYARSACLKEFNGKDNKTLIDVVMKTRGHEADTFHDMTREGYMRACLPHIQSLLKESEEPQALRLNNMRALNESSIPNENFNILRDRYERACKKMSCEKCQVACRSAFKNICESYSCNGDRKRQYQKSCKRECKRIYKMDRSSSSSSDSDSDSDTDSSSGSTSSSSD